MDKKLFKEFQLTYLNLQKLLLKEYQETKDPEIKEMIESAGENYLAVKKAFEEKLSNSES